MNPDELMKTINRPVDRKMLYEWIELFNPNEVDPYLSFKEALLFRLRQDLFWKPGTHDALLELEHLICEDLDTGYPASTSDIKRIKNRFKEYREKNKELIKTMPTLVGIHCPLCGWHQVVPLDEWYFQHNFGHGHMCGSDKCPSHTDMVLDNHACDEKQLAELEQALKAAKLVLDQIRSIRAKEQRS